MTRLLYEYHPVVGYRFVPGVRARVRHEGGGYLVRANAAGFRSDHEVHAAPVPGRTRLFLFGDSYTAGEGVSNADRFGEQLEARLPGLEIHNFGLPGSGTDQQYLAWRELARDAAHDVLLLCPMVENVRRNPDTHRLTQSASDGKLVLRAKPYFTLQGDTLALQHQPVPKQVLAQDRLPADARASNLQPEGGSRGAARRLVDAVDARLPGFRGLTHRLRGVAWPPEYERPDDPGWRLMRAILLQWMRESRVPVLLCPLPTFAHIDGDLRPDGYLARFGEVAREGGAQFIDILPALHRRSSKDRHRMRFEHDEHPTPFGHRCLAEALQPALAAWLKAHATRRAAP